MEESNYPNYKHCLQATGSQAQLILQLYKTWDYFAAFCWAKHTALPEGWWDISGRCSSACDGVDGKEL